MALSLNLMSSNNQDPPYRLVANEEVPQMDAQTLETTFLERHDPSTYGSY